MTLRIFRLNVHAGGFCVLCAAKGIHEHMDEDLGGLICADCKEPVKRAEYALLDAGLAQPPPVLIHRNPR